MRHSSALAALTAFACVALFGAAVPAQAAAAGFQTQASSNAAGSDYDELDGVADIGATNDLAVGYYGLAGQTGFHALAEWWNGRTWSILSLPVPLGDDTRLHAITAATSIDVWAVGSDAGHGLILHRGTALTWSVVPSPANEPSGSELDSVTEIASNDVWAVGHSNSGGTGAGLEPLIEHWNGTAWTVVPGASITDTGYGALTGVAGSSADDVWAVGHNGSPTVPVVEHWNGSAWTQVAQPVSGSGSSLNAIAVVNGTDVWAVGEQNQDQTVVENWNGSAWTVVPSPSVTTGGTLDTLSGVSAIGASDVWAVGSTSVGSVSRTLAEHWDGTSWQIVSSANPGTGSNVLNSLAQTAPGGPLRAVGSSSGGTPPTATLVETTVG